MCSTWGDPHIHSWYGEQFTFQGYGEYLFASLALLSGTCNIQIRQEPCATTGVTFVSAVSSHYYSLNMETNFVIRWLLITWTRTMVYISLMIV